MNAMPIIVGFSLAFSFLLVLRILHIARLAESGRKTIRQQEILIDELKAVHANLNTLKGILPICAFCKKIRDENGDWNQLERYIRQHSEAEFTHGLCPDCYSMALSDIPDGLRSPGKHLPAARRVGVSVSGVEVLRDDKESLLPDC